MINIKRTIFITAILGILLAPSFSSAITIAEIQAQLNALLIKVQQLQEQLAQYNSGTFPSPSLAPSPTPPPTTGLCHTFNTNLKYGDTGTEVQALQTALEKEGFVISAAEKSSLSFLDSTASAIVGFQNKYKAEILSPWNLTNGTGYVGTTTRTKLNALYGCTGGGGVGTTITYSNLIENAVPTTITTGLNYNHADILVDGQNIYVAIASKSPQIIIKVFKSTDKGKTWTDKTSNLGLQPSKAYSWVALRKSEAGNSIYLWTADINRKARLFVTTNGGDSWNVVMLPNDLQFSGSQKDFDILSFDSNNLLIAYNSYNVGLKIAKSSDGGNNWNSITLDKYYCPAGTDCTNSVDYIYPQVDLLSNGDIALIYFKLKPSNLSRERSILYRKSSDKGSTWSSSTILTQGRSVRYNDTTFGQFLYNPHTYYFLFTSGINKTVGYIRREFNASELTNNVPALIKLSGSILSDKHIRTSDNLNATTYEDSGSSFSASNNSQFMGFLVSGFMVPDGYFSGNGTSVANGTILLYSINGGNNWIYKKILPDFIVPQQGLAPNFYISDNGEVLIVYADLKSSTIKFIGGKLDTTTPSYTPPVSSPTPTPTPTITSGGSCGDGICSDCMGFSPCYYNETSATCPQDCKLAISTIGAPTCSINFYPSAITSGQTAIASWVSLNDADAKLDYVCKNSSNQIITGGDNQYVEALGTAKFKYEEISQYLPATCTLTAKNSIGNTSQCSATLQSK